MIVYSGQLDSIPNSDFTQVISAGTQDLTMRFQWDTANQEQYDIIDRALQQRAAADPLLKGDSIIRDYSWLDWYLDLPSDIETALEEGMEYPQSLKQLYPNNLALMADILYERKEEAKALQIFIAPMTDQLVWNVTITDSDGESITGVVRPGGWLHNQDINWRVRFVSDLTSIGYDDLLKATIEVAVNND